MANFDTSQLDVMPGTRLRAAARSALIVGVVGLGLSFFMGLGGEHGGERFYFSYLVNFCFFVSLALGAFFFTFVQHLVAAGWSVVVRRFAEVVATCFLPLAVLFIPIWLGRHALFHWMDPAVVANDHLLTAKAPYLNPTFFIIRAVVYFAVWGLLSWYFYRRSVQQDETGDFRISIGLKKLSAPTALIFAITSSVFAIDMLMSLDPHWFSTIFGVYFFAGSTVAFFSLLPILLYLAQRNGRLEGIVNAEHFQDLGKLMFAFTIFWTYIAFSQYMLIWYANIPEETEWFLKRQTGEWTTLSWMLLIGRFILPFIMLISRYPKRRPKLLIVPAAWMIFMHWIDIYYLAMPELPHGTPGVIPWSAMDLTCFLGIGGVFAAWALFRQAGVALIPKQDPRLVESLEFEQGGG